MTYPDDYINKVICGDCLEVMKGIPDNSVDLIITSPPYEDISGAGYVKSTKDILFMKLYSEFLDKIFTEYYRLLKLTGQIFFNIKSKTHNKTLRTPHWIEFLESFNKFLLKSYIIWKYAGSFDSTNKRFHLDYEIIYHLSKTNNIYLNANCGIKDPLSSVWYVPHNIPKEDRKHPTQMPIQLVNRILTIISKPTDVVLDNFAGISTTALGCKQFKCKYINIEIDPNYCRIARERLKDIIHRGCV